MPLRRDLWQIREAEDVLSVINNAIVVLQLSMNRVWSVNPGFGGQSYIPGSTAKIARLRAMLDAINSPAELEVDGGINPITIKEVVTAGATVLVAGSAIFNQRASVADNVQQLRASCK
jgi:ribulose-phosphate 3-epimerase